MNYVKAERSVKFKAFSEFYKKRLKFSILDIRS